MARYLPPRDEAKARAALLTIEFQGRTCDTCPRVHGCEGVCEKALRDAAERVIADAKRCRL
jgi:hypothetical protein